MAKLEEVTCFSEKEWRSWLRKNYHRKDRAMLVRYKKHTGKESFNQSQAMNEAICFGWIDTTIKRLDDERYGVTFVKRNKNSKWSENTLARAEELIKKGKMSKFGFEMYELGKTKKTHDHGIPKNPEMPEELKKELDKKENKKARECFEKLAPSYKRMYFRWFLSAKRPETRKKRIDLIVKNVLEGKKWGE